MVNWYFLFFLPSFFCLCFETGSLYISLAVLELAMLARLALSSWTSFSYLNLPGAYEAAPACFFVPCYSLPGSHPTQCSRYPWPLSFQQAHVSCVHYCTHVCGVGLQGPISGRQVCTILSSLSSFLSLSNRTSHWSGTCQPIRLGWLASEPQGSAWLCFLGSGIRSTHCHTQLLNIHLRVDIGPHALTCT